MVKQRYTEKKKESNLKWDKEHLRNGSFKMPIELYEQFEKYCTENGCSKNGLINLVKEKLERDGYINDEN